MVDLIHNTNHRGEKKTHLIAPLDVGEPLIISICFCSSTTTETFLVHFHQPSPHDSITLTSRDLGQSAFTAGVKLYCSVAKQMGVRVFGNDPTASPSEWFCGGNDDHEADGHLWKLFAPPGIEERVNNCAKKKRFVIKEAAATEEILINRFCTHFFNTLL